MAKTGTPKKSANQSSLYTERSLAISCTRAREAIVKRYQPLLRREGFTEQQWRVLRFLYDFELVPLAELGKRCCIHKVSMTRIIRTLIKEGLVERKKQADDLRSYDISLSRKGLSLLAKMTPTANDIHDQIAKDFGKENTQTLLSLLKRLSEIDN